MPRLNLLSKLCMMAALVFMCSLGAVTTAQAGGFTFAKGDIVVGVGNGMYKVFDPTGATLLATLDTTTGSSEDTGGAFDANGNLFVTNFEANSVSEFDVHGNLITANFGSGYDLHPESITFNAAGDIFIGQADGSAQVLEFSPGGTLLNTFAPARENRGTDWIDLAPDGKTLYYTSEGSAVHRFDLSTNTQLSDFATGLTGGTAYALRILPNGDVLVADTSQVVLLDTGGNVIHTYTASGLGAAFALNILPDGKSFLTGNIDSKGEIFQFNIASGALENTFLPSPSVDVAGLIVFGELGIGPPPSPVPEPSSLFLLGTGLIGLGWMARRKMFGFARIS